MIDVAFKRNSFNLENYQHKPDIMMPENSGININTQGDVTALSSCDLSNGESIVNLSTISTNVTTAVDRLPASPPPEQEGIRELLERLQKMIEADENLKPENKAQALEQVKALAEASKNPLNEGNKNTANSAMKILTGMIEEVPKAVNYIEACDTFLPQISTIFGLG